MSDFTGRNLGKYQLRERLGRGGMADVYKAYQPGMDRFVAVKLMHGHLAESEDFIERFRREAQSVGQLRHPNIVQVIDFDVEDDVYYMVMEYIKGDTLKTYIRQRGALPVAEALRITESLADALAYAHQHEMVHRDIKPANVMFTDASFKHPVLTDFGIARILGASGITVSGAFIGTPAYMSPEAGRGTKVDERADIYSLGVMLYEMLTGRVPYDADTPFAVVMKHVNEPLPSIRQIRDDVPESVELVLLKALAKYPEERFQTAADMKGAIHDARDGLSGVVSTHPSESTETGLEIESTMIADTSATNIRADETATMIEGEAATPMPGTLPPSVAPSTQKLPWWQIAGAIVGILAIIAVIVLIVTGGDEDSGGSEPALAEVTETATREPSSTPTEAAASATPTPSITLTSTLTVEPSSTPTDEPTVLPTDEPTIVASDTLIEQGDSLRAEGDLQGAIGAYESAIEVDPDATGAYLGRARTYLDVGDLDKALEDFNRVIELDENAEAYVGLGTIYQQQEEFDTAIENFSRAIELDPEASEAYAARGAIYLRLERVEEALDDLNKAIDLNPANPEFVADRARVYSNHSRWEEALTDYDAAIEAMPDDIELYADRGWVRYWLNDYEGAVDDFERALSAFPNDPDLLISQAAALVGVGDYEAALESAESVLEIDADYAAAYWIRGIYQASQGDWQTAIDEYDRAIELGVDDPEVYLSRAEAYLELEQRLQALSDLNEMIELTPNDVDAYVLRAMVYTEMGNFQQAADDLERALELDESQAEAYLALGQLYDRQGRVEDALEAYRSYLNLSGDDADGDIVARVEALTGEMPGATTNTAERYTAYVESDLAEAISYANRIEGVYLDQGYEAAFALLNEGLETYPDDPVLLSIRSGFYLQADDLEAALTDAQRVVELYPDHPVGYLALSRYYFESPEYDYEQGFEYAAQALEKAPNQWEVLFHYGRALYHTGNLETAVRYYDRAQQAGGPLYLIVPTRAHTYWELRDCASAVEDYVFVVEEYDDLSARYMAAGCYILLDEPEAAMQLIEDGFATEDDDANYWANAAYIALRAGQLDTATEWANTALAYNGGEEVALYVTGLIAAREDQYDKALEYLTVVEPLAAWRYSWPYLNERFGHYILLDIARVYAAKGNDETAEQYYDRAAEAEDDFLVYLQRGRFYLSRDRIEDGFRDYGRAIAYTRRWNEQASRSIAQELIDMGTPVAKSAIALLIAEENTSAAILLTDVALEAEPENGELLALRAEAYLVDGDLETAYEEAERAIQADPHHPGGYIVLADYYSWSDQPAEWLESALWAFRLAPQDPRAVLTYARALRDMGDNTTAMQLFNGIDADESPAILQERGDYALEQGDYGLAIDDFAQLLDLQPDNPQAILGLATGYLLIEDIEAVEHVLKRYTALEIEDERARQEYDLNFALLAYRIEADELARTLVEQVDPDNPTVIYLRGLLAAREDEYEQALELLQSLESVAAWEYAHPFLQERYGHTLSFDIARVYRALGDLEQATAYYQDIPWNVFFYIERGEFYKEIGETEAARADFRQAENLTDDPELRERIREHIVELGPAPRPE